MIGVSRSVFRGFGAFRSITFVLHSRVGSTRDERFCLQISSRDRNRRSLLCQLYVHIYCSNRSTNRCFFSRPIGCRVHSYALLLPMFLFNGPRVSQSLFLTHSWLKTRVLAQFRPHCHSNEATCMRNRGRVTMTFA